MITLFGCAHFFNFVSFLLYPVEAKRLKCAMLGAFIVLGYVIYDNAHPNQVDLLFDSLFSVSLPHGVMVWSAVCDCAISWSY